jgi:hypothetical protein
MTESRFFKAAISKINQTWLINSKMEGGRKQGAERADQIHIADMVMQAPLSVELRLPFSQLLDIT